LSLFPRFAAALGSLVIATGAVQAAPVTIATLFNTGVDASGQPLANGTVPDPHYRLVTVPTGSSMNTRVIDPSGGFPIGPYFVGSNLSRWIVANNPESGGGAGDNSPMGTYVFRTTFDLTGYDFTTASITGGWVSDNNGIDILINGTSLNFTNPGNFGVGFTSFAVSSGFVAGINTLDFKVNNASGTTGNPVALRVEMTGTANAVPTPASLALVMVAGMAALGASRRRT